MSSKCRPGSLGRGDLCRTAIAFDLACRALACPVPHKTAVKLSGLPSEALYVAALGTAQRSANSAAVHSIPVSQFSGGGL